MTYKLSYIAQEIGVEFVGVDVDIDGIHTLIEASASQISFINSPKYLNDLPQTEASAVIVQSKYQHLVPPKTIALITDEPYLTLALATKLFRYIPTTQTQKPTVGSECDIDNHAYFGIGVTLGDRVTIMAGCYVGDEVTIGSDTILYPNTTIYHHSTVGSECILHSGAVVGADGYGFAHTKDGKHIKIHQNGNVHIGDSVEIGANTTIDRAVFGSTIIGSGTKIDNLVQIGHNCEIGEDCLLVCQTALAGSTKLGDSVTMGGQSGATGHLEIGSHATIASRAGVTKSLAGGEVYGGFPAMRHSKWLKIQAKLSLDY